MLSPQRKQCKEIPSCGALPTDTTVLNMQLDQDLLNNSTVMQLQPQGKMTFRVE
jgi:hypothetical protein